MDDDYGRHLEMNLVCAVLFDLDHTLCRYDRSGAEILEDAFDAVGIDPFFTVDEYYAALPEFIDHDREPAVWREQAFAAIAERKGHVPDRGRTVADAYAERRDQTDVSCLPGARASLETLGQSYRLGLVTNGHPKVQRQKLVTLSLNAHFETIVFAGYDTPTKPDPAPFERAIEELGANPNATLVVGDSLEADVAGAKEVGMHAARVANGENIDRDDPQPDYVLDTLYDLVEEPWREDERLQ